MNGTKSSRHQTTKRPYREPALKVHGDFRKLTAVKPGTNNDGATKPATRAGTPNA